MIPATSKVHVVVAAMILTSTACDKGDGDTSFADILYSLQDLQNSDSNRVLEQIRSEGTCGWMYMFGLWSF